MTSNPTTGGDGIDAATADPETHDGLAGCDEVRVARAVTGARPGRHGVVTDRRRPMGVAGADGQDVWVVRRVVELRATESGVAARDHDNDSLTPGRLCGVRERVEPVVLNTVRPEGEVEDADVQPIRVAVLDNPVDSCDHLRDIGSTAPIRNLDRHDSRIGCDATEVLVVPGISPPPCGNVAPGDDTGHVRAVAERIEVTKVVLLGLERQVWAIHQLVGIVESFDR